MGRRRYTIGIVQLVVLILAFPARMSGRDKWISAGILGLYIIQTVLPGLRSVSPLISALHPLNAMLLFAISFWYARHARRIASMPAGAPAMAAEASAKAG